MDTFCLPVGMLKKWVKKHGLIMLFEYFWATIYLSRTNRLKIVVARLIRLILVL